MQTEELSFLLGGDGITVATTSGRGFTPEENNVTLANKLTNAGYSELISILDS
jgi:hypothetical protein